MSRYRLFVALPLSALLACTGVPDADEDLLSDNFELAIGTNPEIADSDGDGYTDAEEWLRYYNPMDNEDHPSEESDYVRFPSPSNVPDGDGVDSEGWDEGDTSNNWQAQDQHGEFVDLHDFYGQVILIDVAAEWCNPCRQAAPAAEEHYQETRPDGFVVLNLLLDGMSQSEAPDPNRWATDLDLTFPIFGDHQQEIATHYIVAEGGGFSIPNFSFIGRDMEVARVYDPGSPADLAYVDELMEDAIPYVEWPMPEDVAEVRETLSLDLGHADVHLDTNIELGIELAGSAGGSAGGATDGGATDNVGVGTLTPANPDGSYAGPPFGGTSCNAAGGSAGLLALLLGLLALPALRRN